MNPIIAQCLAPYAPRNSEVHTILHNDDFYKRVDAAMADDKANDKRFFEMCQQALRDQVRVNNCMGNLL